MNLTLAAIFKNVLFRLAIVYAVWYGYSQAWKWSLVPGLPHGSWTLAVLAAGFVSGLMALALSMTAPKLNQTLWRDRIYNALPMAIGSMALLITIIFFPGAFCVTWFSGFLAALPVPVSLMLIRVLLHRRAAAASVILSGRAAS